MRKFYPFFLFLRAIINIPIQTLIISPWLLFRKMIISQLELESPVHAAALVAVFSRIERQFTSENFHTHKKKTLSTTTNLNSPLLTLYFRPDIVWRLLIRPFSYPQICIKFKNMQAWLRRSEKRILSKWSKLPMCDESLSPLPIKAKQRFAWATCMSKLPNVAQQNCLFLSKGNLFSCLWTAYSTLTFLKPICERQNHLKKWSSQIQSIPAHSWSFPGK